jgi:hypothetical protein
VQFQVASTNITGTIFCHNSADEVFIRLVAGSGSLPTFMDDTLLVAALDEIRSASYDECEKAMNAGKLGHDSGMLIKSVPTRFSIGGALLAQSDGLTVSQDGSLGTISQELSGRRRPRLNL